MEITDFKIGGKVYLVTGCTTDKIIPCYIIEVKTINPTTVRFIVTQNKNLIDSSYYKTILEFNAVDQRISNSDYVLSYNEAIEKLHANRIKFTLKKLESIEDSLRDIRNNIEKWF